MSEPHETNFDPAAARQRLAARLDAFRQRLRWHLGVAGAVRVVLLTIVLVLTSFLIDRTFRVGLVVRLPLLAMGLAAIGYDIYKSIVRPLMLPADDVQLADALDRIAGRTDLAPRVATAMQPSDDPNASAALRAHAVQRAHAELDRVDLLDRLDTARLGLRELAVAGLVVLLAAIAAAFPQSSGIWAKRWLAWQNTPWPQKTYLDVAGLTDGRLLVPRGEAATVFVRVRPGSLEPKQVDVTVRPPGQARVDAVMSRFAAGDFRHDLPPVNASETIEISGGDEELDAITVQPVERPRVEKLLLVTRHPTEPKPTEHTFAGDEADLRFLPQTACTLRLRVSTPLSKLTLGETGVAVKQTGEQDYEIAWTHRRTMNFQIGLVAAGTGLESAAVPLSVGLLVDQPPRVSLSYTGVRQRITPQATIPLTIDARDDYGIAAAGLSVKTDYLGPDQQRTTHATTQPLYGPQSPADEKDLQLTQQFAVADLKPPVGTLVTVAATATDARYEGPQTARSKEATFRVVSPPDLFKEILTRQQAERAKFRKLAGQSAELHDALAGATAEQAAALSRRFRESARETERIGTSLSESLTEMKLNALGTAESYALMERNITGPLKTLTGGLMVEQRDALDAAAAGGPLDPAGLASRQDRITDGMNAILKQMTQWDSFVDVLNQLNEIIRLQEQAKRTTDQLKTKEADSAFDK